MAYDIDIAYLPEQPAATVRGHVEQHEIPEFLGRVFGEVLAALRDQHLQPAGPPFARYRAARDGEWEIEAGFPATGAVRPQGEVQPAQLPGGRVAHTLHRGQYDEVGAAYEALDMWLQQHHSGPHGQPWESYLDGPEAEQPRTELFVPCG